MNESIISLVSTKLDLYVDEHFVIAPKDPEHWDMIKEIVPQNDGSKMLLVSLLLKGSEMHKKHFAKGTILTK